MSFWSHGSSTARGTYSFIQLENDGQNQQTALSIDTSGNIGIGNASPTHELDILGGNTSTLRHNSLRIMSNSEAIGSETNIMHNVKYDSGYKYVVADEAARIRFINGITSISRAVAGSAGISSGTTILSITDSTHFELSKVATKISSAIT